MGINSKLKREGIKVVEKLDNVKVNTIAANVVKRLCKAFPEHHFESRRLFELLSKISMYTAEMPEDLSGAKYVLRNNSIYFSMSLNLKEMVKLAVHECIHCMQHYYVMDITSKKIGLCDFSSNVGLSINEAAVQLMASEANRSKKEEETYYGITINTISPNYYPLECTLMREITYFTGSYPLYHSTLYSNDIFKNMLILKTGKKAYNTIVKNFDKILTLENDLNYFITELQYANKPNSIKNLNNLINTCRTEITKTFYKTQNLIMDKCFKSEFNNIKNSNDIARFTKKLYNFKNIMGYSDNYSFYNNFYIQMMGLVQRKKESIEQYGDISLYEEINKSLTIVESSKNLLYYINKFATKVKKLAKLNRGTEDNINNL